MQNPSKEDMQQRIEQFAGQVVTDLAAAMAGVMTNLGHKLGFYRAMAESGPINSDELARRTATNERSVREWLNGQVAGGYVLFDPETNQYLLPLEHTFVLANPDSPAFLPPAFDVAAALWRDEDEILAAFRSGKGMGWHEHNCRLFSGTEAFFRTGYRAHLTQTWIPSLSGVKEQLTKGGRVADVGCGHGVSTRLMAEAFPNSRFYGFDYHEGSIQAARQAASEAKLGGRVSFDVHSAKSYPADGYDLVCFFDCLHDMGDPVGAIKHVRESMAEDGTCMLIEPFANDRLEDNLNPVGRFYYAASTMICTPASLDQEVGLALGAQAGEARLRDVARAGGLTRFRRAAETPFNLILEARI